MDEEERKRRRDAVLAAFGTTLGLAGYEGGRNALFDAKEKTLKATRDWQKFKEQLKPGDIAFQRSNYDSKTSDLHKYRGQRDMINAIKGDTLYHPMMITGKNRALQATGSGTKLKKTAFVTADDYPAEWRVYRPKDAKQIPKALQYAEEIVGKKVPYPSYPELLEHGAKHLAGIREPTGTGKFCKGAVCTAAVAEGYPKYFKDQLTSAMAMRQNKNLELIARYNPIGDLSMREKLLAYGAHPLLKNAKWGLLAGAGMYGASKLNDVYKEY